MILLHIIQRYRAQSGRGRLAQHRITGRQQAYIQGARSAVAGALQIAGNKLSGLVLDYGKCLRRKRGMQFVVGQQFHSAGEVLLQHLHGEVEACGLVGGDVIQRLLKSQAVERLRAVGIEAVENIGDSFLPLGCLQIGVVLNRTYDGYGWAGGIGLHDQAKTVGQRRIRGDDVVGRDLQLGERRWPPKRAAQPAW